MPQGDDPCSDLRRDVRKSLHSSHHIVNQDGGVIHHCTLLSKTLVHISPCIPSLAPYFSRKGSWQKVKAEGFYHEPPGFPESRKVHLFTWKLENFPRTNAKYKSQFCN